jgi:hypothetical protein
MIENAIIGSGYGRMRDQIMYDLFIDGALIGTQQYVYVGAE